MDINELKVLADELNFTLEMIKNESKQIQISDERIKQLRESSLVLKKITEEFKAEFEKPLEATIQSIVHNFGTELEKKVKTLAPITIELTNAVDNIKSQTKTVQSAKIKNTVLLTVASLVASTVIAGTVGFWQGHKKGVATGANDILANYGLELDYIDSYVRIAGKPNEVRDSMHGATRDTNQPFVAISLYSQTSKKAR